MWRALIAGLTLALCAAASARADTYSVTGTDDTVTPPPCTQVFPTVWQCPTLRSAITAANATTTTDDVIGLTPGTVQLTAGALTITDSVSIAGSGLDQTTVGGTDLSDRVFTITGASEATLSGLTVAGGFSSGLGGNLLVEIGSTLTLSLARVTGGNAASGGGIANRGTLTLQTTLIDGNTAQASGGGIANRAEAAAARTTVLNSTIADNTAAAGAGLYSVGSAETRLTHVTIGRNTGAGVQLAGPQTAIADATIVAANTVASCVESSFTSATASLEDGTTCGFPLENVDPGLSAGLVAFNTTGYATSVLTIPASSPAIDLVNPCLYPFDQRLEPRFTAALAPCDAGAFELAASGVGGQPPPVPTPVVPTPVPTPVPTATPVPTPVFNQAVVAAPVRGTVLVKERGSTRFVTLSASDAIPFGSTVDTRKGRVELTSLSGPGGTPQKAQFYDGLFTLVQKGQVTELQLVEALDCRAARAASAAQKKLKTRKLWGDGKGKFRTKGRYSAATIRGTTWLVQDGCRYTLTRVTQGSVLVRDAVRKRNIVLRKGKRYTARPRG